MHRSTSRARSAAFLALLFLGASAARSAGAQDGGTPSADEPRSEPRSEPQSEPQSEPNGVPNGDTGSEPSEAMREHARLARAAARGQRSIPSLDTTGFEVVAPKRAYASWTIEWKVGGEPHTLERTVLRSATGGIAASGGARHANYVLRQVLIEPDPAFKTQWGIRGYEMDGWVLDEVEIRNMGGKPGKPEGHALYANVAGDLTLEGCSFHHNKGQAVQVVARPNAGTAPAFGTLIVRDCVFAENGFDSDRAGFQVSVFGPGFEYDVEIERTRIEGLELASWIGPDGLEYAARGGLCIAPVAGRKNFPAWFDERDPPFTNGRVHIDGLEVRLARPYQALALFRGIRELVVEGSTFEGGLVVIDPPGSPGRDCGRVEWRGNRGDATLWYRGEALGPVSGDYVLGTTPSAPAAER